MSSSGPLLGYNNNIPYKGQVYHVQTEDSGARRPHVITHLFADGGRIVKTTKTSYADIVGSDNVSERVRALMREQHKSMVIALRDGQLDHLLADGAVPELEERPSGPEAESRPSPPPMSQPLELLERAAHDDNDFAREMQDLVPGAEPSRKASDPSPGSYSFVGRRSGTPSSSRPPPSEPPVTQRRGGSPGTPPTGSPLQRKPVSDPPPVLGVAPPRPPRPPAVSDIPFDDRPTTPFTEQARVPLGIVQAFGARYISSRRFDEVVLAFLRRENQR